MIDRVVLIIFISLHVPIYSMALLGDMHTSTNNRSAVTPQQVSIPSLKNLAKKSVAGALATSLQSAANAQKSPSYYMAEVNAISEVLKSIPYDIAEDIGKLMLAMVDTVNCKDPERRNSLFYLRCCFTDLPYKELYRPPCL